MDTTNVWFWSVAWLTLIALIVPAGMLLRLRSGIRSRTVADALRATERPS